MGHLTTPHCWVCLIVWEVGRIFGGEWKNRRDLDRRKFIFDSSYVCIGFLDAWFGGVCPSSIGWK